jgi:GNAT superfamily N-acetyltransferase
MSLYADYVKERGVFNIVELEQGFATYRINGVECYIEDIYVVPEARNKHIATLLADRISEEAKEKGCRYLACAVVPGSNKSTDSLKVVLAYGFKVLKSDQNAIYLIKEL